MNYEPVLNALSDPTRRQIVDRIRPGPLSVAEIAEPLPVSRPAVSQHLKVLKEAGLVTVERQGTRNLYALAPTGLDMLRAWIDALWDDALESFSRAAAAKAQREAQIEPVTKAVHVRLSPEEAFYLLTEDIALWWPVSSHSLSAADGGLPQSVVLTPRPGGQIIETLSDGSTAAWGTITQWDPPRRVHIDWHVGRPQIDATKLELRCDDAGRGAKVTLIHSGWEILGKDAATERAQYDSGWDHVLLDRYAATAAASLSNFAASI